MKILRGAPALSTFRVNQLLKNCEALNLPVTQIYAEFMHAADLTESLNEQESVVLQNQGASNFRGEGAVHNAALPLERPRLMKHSAASRNVVYIDVCRLVVIVMMTTITIVIILAPRTKKPDSEKLVRKNF